MELVAVVFDMSQTELRAALYRIIHGDDLKTALERAKRVSKLKGKTEQAELFGSD
jgi:hypothetical protein